MLYVAAIVSVIWGTLAWGDHASRRQAAVPIFAAAGPAADHSVLAARSDAERIAAEKEALAAAMTAREQEAERQLAAEPSPSFAPNASPAGPSAPTILPAPTPGSSAPAAPSPSAASTVQASVYQPGAKPVTIPVLNYHSVAVDPGNIVVIHPDKFAEQMDYLNDNGYTPLSLSDFILMLERKKELPAKPVLLTFDDGYTDNVETAMPILQKHRFPATLFMSPGMVDTDGYINWEQAKTLRDAGWDIQPHGMTHPSLPKLKADEQAFEIGEAKKQIEAQLGNTVEVFCYPYGQYNETSLRLLSEHNYRYAFTIDQGKTASSQHPYKLKRIFVNGEEGLGSLVHKLTKW